MTLVLAIYVGGMRMMSKKYTATYGTTLIEKIVGKKIYRKYINQQITLGQLTKIYKQNLKELNK